MAEKLPLKRAANPIDSVAKRQFLLALFVLTQAYKVNNFTILLTQAHSLYLSLDTIGLVCLIDAAFFALVYIVCIHSSNSPSYAFHDCNSRFGA
jgi:hypothetical protein